MGVTGTGEPPVTRAAEVEETELWQRLATPAFSFLPYGLLTIATVLSVAVHASNDQSITLDLVLSAITGAWTLWMFTLHPGWARRTVLMRWFFAVWVVLAAALVIHAPWFGFYTFSGYLFAGVVLEGRWQLAGVAATAVVTATSQGGGLPKLDATSIAVWVLLVGINVTVATIFTRYGLKTERQNEQRREVMLDLRAANERLEQSLAVNAQLQEELLDRAREAGILAERQRLAGEIHDTLAQDLVGIITQLEALEQGAAGGEALPPGLTRRVEVAAQLARGALDEARRSVQALRPAPLSDARLADALVQVAGRWSTIHGVTASVETHGAVRPLRPELEVALLRAAQEALANVARHAGARRVGVTLSYMDEVVTLDVRDDGVGFDPASVQARSLAVHGIDAAEANGAADGEAHAPRGGFGLVAMRERIRGVAGTLEIESEPGHGTAVSASVPAVPLGAS